VASAVRACHLTKLTFMDVPKDLYSWKFILEARIERERPYTCLRMVCDDELQQSLVVFI
jgi:hypothetical protein